MLGQPYAFQCVGGVIRRDFYLALTICNFVVGIAVAGGYPDSIAGLHNGVNRSNDSAYSTLAFNLSFFEYMGVWLPVGDYNKQIITHFLLN